VPLTDEELKLISVVLDGNIHIQRNRDRLQRLLDDYANLKHFHSVANGWQGLNALQVNYEIVKH
jgi:hypothetical protein